MEEELLAAIYEHPDDDAPRLVYMDYLLERGDPRGELISLQMRKRTQALTPEELRTERTLLAAHGEVWIPREVRSRIQGGGIRFERGFLARCLLRQSEQPTGSRQLAHPAWRTVHTICAPGRGLGVNRVLLEPALAGVRRLQLSSAPLAAWLLRESAPRAVEVLGFTWYGSDELALVQQLCAATNLPALRHLILQLVAFEALQALVTSELVARLDQLSLWNEYQWRALPAKLQARVRHVTFDAVDASQAIFHR